MADNWLKKMTSVDQFLPSRVTEKLADLLFEIGVDLMARNDSERAIRWLDHARELLVSPAFEQISNNAEELRSTIMQYLIRALSKTPGEDAKRRVFAIADDLELVGGSGISWLLARLDLYDSNPETAPQDYLKALLKLIRAIEHLTEMAVNLVLRYVHKLRSRSSDLAHTALVVFLTKHSVDANTGWIERVLVTIIWNMTTSAYDANQTNLCMELKEVLNTMSSQCSFKMGPMATHASQMAIQFPSSTSKCFSNRFNSSCGSASSIATTVGTTPHQDIGAH